MFLTLVSGKEDLFKIFALDRRKFSVTNNLYVTENASF